MGVFSYRTDVVDFSAKFSKMSPKVSGSHISENESMTESAPRIDGDLCEVYESGTENFIATTAACFWEAFQSALKFLKSVR